MPRLIHPVVLSGGSGTRLWPESRAAHPKQFLPLTSRRSLLQETILRVADARAFAPPLTVCNEEHRFLVAEQLREIAVEPGAIVLEPVGRNTAPAIAAAAEILAARDRDALMLVLPSDHAIGDAAGFRAAVETAAPAAAEGFLVTFGLRPTRPETGYGYIAARASTEPAGAGPAPGCLRVERFVEKPDRETARGYLAEGGWYWNSGMFLFTARAFLAECARLAPALRAAARASVAGAEADADFLRLASEPFRSAPAGPVDRAIMERTDKAAVVPAEMGWSDLGSWAALWQAGARDEDGNLRRGDTFALEATDSLIAADGPLVAALGIDGLAVVATPDAVLVAPLARADEVGTLAQQLAAERLAAERREAPNARARIHRPWGFFQTLHGGAGFQVKRITVKPGAAISLQRHRHRAEHWIVLRGAAEVVKDGATFTLRANETTHVPPLCVHRLANPGPAPLDLIEVQTGRYLGEDDIERFEDKYGRAPTRKKYARAPTREAEVAKP